MSFFVGKWRRSYPARRYAAGSYDQDGVFSPGAVTAFTVKGVPIQPLNGTDLEALPEGDRATVTRKFYTPTLLRTVDQENAIPADEVSVDEGDGLGPRWYRVYSVKREWEFHKHFKVFLERLKEPEEPTP